MANDQNAPMNTDNNIIDPTDTTAMTDDERAKLQQSMDDAAAKDTELDNKSM